VNSTSGKVFPTINPSTGDKIANVQEGDKVMKELTTFAFLICGDSVCSLIQFCVHWCSKVVARIPKGLSPPPHTGFVWAPPTVMGLRALHALRTLLLRQWLCHIYVYKMENLLCLHVTVHFNALCCLCACQLHQASHHYLCFHCFILRCTLRVNVQKNFAFITVNANTSSYLQLLLFL